MQYIVKQRTRPVIGITLGDPAGIGPEVVAKSLSDPQLYAFSRPLLIGDIQVLTAAAELRGRRVQINL
jgi:4-hydroxythreonine-4-phosphate dehydrogenase